jgi:uncharacterized membrane protein YcaP (DUF421 family)
VWHSIWHLDLSAAEKVVRPILIYGFLVLALRVFGRRELGQANTLDLIVMLLIANAVQNGIIGDDVSVTGAFIGAAVLFALNEGLNRVTANRTAEKIVVGAPTYLIRNGEVIRRALVTSGISEGELTAIARRQGHKQLAEVGTAILETNGAISMFKDRGVEAID